MRKSRGWPAAAQLVGSPRPVMMASSCLAIDDRRSDRCRPSALALLHAAPVRGAVGERVRRHQARHRFAEPFTFLLYRFVIVTVLLAVIALATGAPWPRSWRFAGHIAVVGLFLQAMYLGGVYTAIARGIPAGISALIVGVQPIIIAAVVGPLLGERVRARQWLGLVLGFLGIGLVLWNKLSLDIGQLEGVAWNVVGLIGITVATLYQKKYCSQMDWRSGGVIQYGAARRRDLRDDADHGRDRRHRLVARHHHRLRLAHPRAVDRRRQPARLADPARRGLAGGQHVLSGAADRRPRRLAPVRRDAGPAGAPGHGGHRGRRRPGRRGDERAATSSSAAACRRRRARISGSSPTAR